ncbi:MMB_0454 family protein [Mycoplasmopsis equigenitalium]|uniref:MMB_0454 family protein n=1 Tax=Mycoplasmopsis equigenitalium TaxID=114883 RepID=UPI003A8B4BE7
MEHLLQKYPHIKPSGNPEIFVTENNNNVTIKLSFWLKKGYKPSQAIKELNTEIENITNSLISSKPDNIQLIILN